MTFGQKVVGDVVIGEVSTINDDGTDNFFRDLIGRLSEVDDDDLPTRLLVGDCFKWLDTV